ncbi:MAG TPA: response regulator [Chloroflexota bacterium]|jgi:DNA-binding NtrC family response regulator|nr:response regulator [Chloroflexota bacterium]
MPTVLLVEDDDPTAALLVELLTGLGFAPERHNNTTAAVAAARRRPFDLIVTDLWLAGEHDRAWENVARLSAAAPGVPLLVLTGHGRALEEGQRRGYDVLLKPFDVEEFEHTIRGMLGPSGRTAGG